MLKVVLWKIVRLILWCVNSVGHLRLLDVCLRIVIAGWLLVFAVWIAVFCLISWILLLVLHMCYSYVNGVCWAVFL